MPVPATTGVERTKVSEMEIGDYIGAHFKYASVPWENIVSELGQCAHTETPLTGEDYSTINGKFYFVKVANGLLVADRVLAVNRSWDTFNGGKVIQGLPYNFGNIIPTMTSNTSPSGVASASSIYGTSWDAYMAFDNKLGDNANNSGAWASANGQTSGWLAYEFTSPKLVKTYSVQSRNYTDASSVSPKNWTFEGWTGSAWDVLDTQTNISWSAAQTKQFFIANKTAYSKYRINVSAVNGGNFIVISELKMFETAGILRSLGGGNAYVDIKSIVPIMTSNTAPSGEAFADSEYQATYKAYRAFANLMSGMATNGWLPDPVKPTGYLGYAFTSEKVVTGYSIIVNNYSQAETDARGPKNWTFEGSNDGGSTWQVLDTRVGITGWKVNERRLFLFNNTTPFKRYRINVTASNGTGLEILELNMFDKNALDNATPSTTDKGYGASPWNEWDAYIVNFPPDKIQAGKTLDDVFHWNGVGTLCQDTPISSLNGSNYRTSRGRYTNAQKTMFEQSNTAVTGWGFRPVFDFVE